MGASRSTPILVRLAHRTAAAPVLALALACAFAFAPNASAASALDQQRTLYRITAAAIARGDRNALARAKAPLADYPLLPNLELAELRARLGSASTAEIDAFLARYQGQLPAERLRAAWLARLAAAGRWDDYLRYEPEPPPDLDRRCEHAWALRRTSPQLADAAAAALWQNPRSLPAACNRVLAAWTARGNPDASQAWARFDGAMQANELTLARYVLRYFVDSRQKADAQLYLRLHDAPGQIATAGLQSGQPRHARIAAHTLVRLAGRDAASAQRQFDALARRAVLDDAGMQEAAPRIALSLAAQSPQAALQWVLGLPVGARSDLLAEDAVRYALRSGDWSGVDAALSLAPGPGRADPRWQYWQARASAQRATADTTGFAPLSGTRDWYGFLAADRLGTPYAMQHVPLAVETARVAAIEQLPPIRRARELALIGEQAESRREWHFAMARLSKPERQVAAMLAGRWGWHTLAIMALAQAEAWNDLALRFPDPFEAQFAAAARREKLDSSWLFAIARQESAMNPGARSPAGALGLMQVMPGTAQLTARKNGIPYKSSTDLLRPETNVVIGSRYMRMMLDDFSQNRVLAAAAYNAGPHRVKQWLGRFPAGVEHDVFVEAIPFRETRKYVQNVLTFAVIYAYLQGRTVPMVRADERTIGAHRG